jgi:hypothetical protein
MNPEITIRSNDRSTGNVALKMAVFEKWRDGRRRDIRGTRNKQKVLAGPGS